MEENRVTEELIIVIGKKDGGYHIIQTLVDDPAIDSGIAEQNAEAMGYTDVHSEVRDVTLGVDKETGELVYMD